MAIAHSLIQDGPFFKIFPSWVYEILANKSSGNVTIEDIPVTAATGCSINFIKLLQQVKSTKDID